MKPGIKDAKEIIRTIRDYYSFDFSDFSMIFFIRRIERILTQYHIPNVDSLIERLKEDNDFFQLCLHNILIDSSEMFRDPTLWIWLRDYYIPKQVKPASKFTIYLPQCISGNELYTLAIMLYETEMTNNVRVIASVLSDVNYGKIKEGFFDRNKIALSADNYLQYDKQGDFSKYYKIINNNAIVDATLTDNVKLIRTNSFEETIPDQVDCIIFRNRMIYYNVELQNRIIENLHQILAPEGYLIIGNRENLEMHIKSPMFLIINEEEKVYKKRAQ